MKKDGEKPSFFNKSIDFLLFLCYNYEVKRKEIIK